MDSTLPSSVSIVPGMDGGRAVLVNAPHSAGLIQLHGAHVTSFNPRRGSDELLWLSPSASAADGGAIRGGVPVCFPWFGSGPKGDFKPSHGLARNAPWTLVGATEDADAVTVEFRLTKDDVAHLPGAEHWPDGLAARYTITFGTALQLALTAENSGGEEVACEAALHTYLRVRDVGAVAVTGIEGHEVLDQLSGATSVAQGPIVFDGEVDVIAHARDAELRLSARDAGEAGTRTTIATVTRTDSADAVLWNPAATKAASLADVPDDSWRGFVCIEAANIGANAMLVPPGGAVTMTATYRPGGSTGAA